MFFEALNELKISDPGKAEELYAKYQKQRSHFFNRRVEELTDEYALTKQEQKNLWGTLLSAEQPPDPHAQSKTVKMLPELWYLKDEEELIDNSLECVSFLGLLKIYWSQAWREFAEQNRATLAARYFLKNQKNNTQDETAKISSAENELITELNISLTKADKILGFANIKATSETNKNGVLKLDANALEYFKNYNIGKASKATIKCLKDIIESPNYCLGERVEFWNSPLSFEKMVAACRWLDLTKKYVQSKKDNPPALPYHFAIQVSELTTKGTKINDDHTKILSDSGKVISAFDRTAYLPLVTAQSLLNINIEILHSLPGKRILNWSLTEATKQHFLNIKTPYTIPIEGGFYTLGEIIGSGTSGPAIAKMKNIISLYSACKYEHDDGKNITSGNLMMYEFIESKRNQSQKLIITLARAFCPGYVNELSVGDSRYHHDKMLVPWLDTEPTFVGKCNDFASQLSFIERFVIEARHRSVELYQRGGILQTDLNWIEIAHNARMPAKLIPQVLECWTKEGFLEEVDDSIFNLGPRYTFQRDMLKEAGEITHKSSLAGKIKNKSRKNRFKSLKNPSLD